MDGAALNKIDQTRALLEPGTEKRMPPIRRGFLKRANAEVHGLRAVAQPLHLRKDEPNPMAALGAGA